MRMTLALLLVGSFLLAQDQAPEQPAPKSAMQRELEGEIMSPCCYGGPVSEHQSGAADQVRVQIAKLISEGKSRDEILDLFVGVYGEQILAQPKATGFNIMAYLMPPMILIFGGIVLLTFMSRMRRSQVPAVAATGGGKISEAFLSRVEKEMKELDI